MNELSYRGKKISGFKTLQVQQDMGDGKRIVLADNGQWLSVRGIDYLEVNGNVEYLRSSNVAYIIGQTAEVKVGNCLYLQGNIVDSVRRLYERYSHVGIVAKSFDIVYGRELVYKDYLEGFATDTDLKKKLKVAHAVLDSPCNIDYQGNGYIVVKGNVDVVEVGNCAHIKGSVTKALSVGNRVYLSEKPRGLNYKKEAEKRAERMKKLKSGFEVDLNDLFGSVKIQS